MDGEARYPWLGRGMGDGVAGADWAAAVEALAAVAGFHGPLADLAFHGTTARRASRIAARGMREGKVMLADGLAVASGAPYRFEPGTHWATPAVAALYAEDRWRQDGRLGGDRPALLAVDRAELLRAGRLVPDLPGAEMPPDTATGRTLGDSAEFERLDSEWRATPGGWWDCLRVFGSFCCLGRPGRSAVVAVLGLDDATRLMAAHGAEPPAPAAAPGARR